MKKEKPIPVVFRVWRKKPHGVLALFPTLAADNQGYYCDSYEHMGQHGAADYSGCIKNTRPATMEEATLLLHELRRIGYKLQVIQRVTPAMVARRHGPEGLVA